MLRLNPFSKKQNELLAKREAERHAAKAKALKDKRSKAGRKAKATRSQRFQGLQEDLQNAYADAENLIAEEEKAGNYQPGDTTEEEDE